VLTKGPENQFLESLEVQIYLENHLPDYMVPSVLIQLDGFPLTPNGKVDRKQLEQQEVTFESMLLRALKLSSNWQRSGVKS